MRLFAASDLHVDYAANRAVINALSRQDYQDDILLIAGDLSDQLVRCREVLIQLRERFAQVAFVPGNHDLWVRSEEYTDSQAKLAALLTLCQELDVHTMPFRVGQGRAALWVVPLFGWYRLPEQGEDSLYHPKPGEDKRLRFWSDNRFVKWPSKRDIVDDLLAMNHEALSRRYDAPVISFSHFLPRQELLFSTAEEQTHLGLIAHDRLPAFNFSRVAGTWHLEEQLRRLGSVVHIHGHQHRDRYRRIDGVLYVSHCLGYPHEATRQAATASWQPCPVWADGRSLPLRFGDEHPSP